MSYRVEAGVSRDWPSKPTEVPCDLGGLVSSIVCKAIIFNPYWLGYANDDTAKKAVLLNLKCALALHIHLKYSWNEKIQINAKINMLLDSRPPYIADNYSWNMWRSSSYRKLSSNMMCSNLAVLKLLSCSGSWVFCLMDISGAMGLFKKLDVGPLELGDYLG